MSWRRCPATGTRPNRRRTAPLRPPGPPGIRGLAGGFRAAGRGRPPRGRGDCVTGLGTNRRTCPMGRRASEPLKSPDKPLTPARHVIAAFPKRADSGTPDTTALPAFPRRLHDLSHPSSCAGRETSDRPGSGADLLGPQHYRLPARLISVLSDARKLAWAGVRGLLPYPDLPRRIRMRRAAFKLITCNRWPGDDATGNDAAQVALLRLLWLQRRIRRAVRSRHTEEAAYLARAVVDACIIGLYCLHSGTAVADLSASKT